MANPFAQTTRSIESTSSAALWVSVSVALLALAIWALWFFTAPLRLAAVSESARLESIQNPHTIQAAVDAVVVANYMNLDQHVTKGDTLLVLDGQQELLRLEKERSLLASKQNELAALVLESSAEQAATYEIERELDVIDRESDASFREQTVRTRIAQADAKRSAKLHEDGHIGDAQYQRDAAVAEREIAAATVSGATAIRAKVSGRVALNDRRIQAAQTQRSIALLEGEIAQSQVEISRLQEFLDDRFIKAVISGRIGQIGAHRPGAVVEIGDTLATIVPDGDIRAVAYFRPDEVLGLLRIGMTGRMELSAFPWTSFGYIEVLLAAIGSEVKDGLIRVEFELVDQLHDTIPVQHGLTGRIEVDVAEYTPWWYVLRSIGKAANTTGL